MNRGADQLILLDTHAWIWLMNDDEPLRSSAALGPVEASAQKAQARVSAISIWEVGMLEAKNRISLRSPVDEWVRQALTAPGISLVPLTPEIALASSRLPSELPGDPADRIIVATARILNATLVTRDKKIIAYSKEGHVSVLAI